MAGPGLLLAARCSALVPSASLSRASLSPLCLAPLSSTLTTRTMRAVHVHCVRARQHHQHRSASSSTAQQPPSASRQLPHVVVLGTGWASHRFVRDIDHNKYHVTVVSPRDHMLFTPLLTSTAVGTLEHRSIIESIRATASERHFDFQQAQVTDIDFDNNKVMCQSAVYSNDEEPERFPIPYDFLVVGIGAVPNTFGVPGVKEHAFFLKEASDARDVRRRIHDCFEAASFPMKTAQEIEDLLTFVVVGGGPTGVEFAAELTDFLREDCTRLYPHIQHRPRVILLEASGAVLSAFDSSLRQYALRRLERQDCHVRLGRSVKEVKRHEVVLDNGEVINTHCIVWSTGVGPRALVKSLDERYLTENKQHIRVDRGLKIANTQNAFAYGDCARIDGYILPAVAQVAEQQGKFLADEFNRATPQREVGCDTFKFASSGMLAYLGHYGGVAKIAVPTPDDVTNVKLSGLTAWLVWRMGYLTKLGRWRNRLQVPFDWLKTMIFGRDPTKF
ncbi:hypothetical protein PTSG_00422 [Salpingoeca rosetta]|uniref:Uncharacterized protein n=1 Tax=Salpingoeca rosetta (strain ATCC 50818 / BSB-021) TaxID=946362 RepID=F2TWF6_SALR5|nr:uncharacterized protein PTSG_00422 [Salpingoeca rosetta]EGD72402.1 hypothetical protein PTSG_00422 [Salpingoeca rosetta]|eukprot:XP_004998971.1 hypothetical protein PTSG_00422 [Salpingoeca rosetta]